MFQAWTQRRSNNFVQYYYFKCWPEINHKKNDVTDPNAFYEFTDFRSHKGNRIIKQRTRFTDLQFNQISKRIVLTTKKNESKQSFQKYFKFLLKTW